MTARDINGDGKAEIAGGPWNIGESNDGAKSVHLPEPHSRSQWKLSADSLERGAEHASYALDCRRQGKV